MSRARRNTVRVILGCLTLGAGVLTTFAEARAQLLRRPPAPTAVQLQALGLTEKSLRVGAAERWFLVQPPVDASRPAPVLIVLHGGTQSMRRLFAPEAGASRGWPELARRENALLLVPNAVDPDTGDTRSDNQNWNDLRQGVAKISVADDVGFLTALLDWAHKTHRTDTARVYVTGASNGGMMTMRLLMEVPEKFTAAAAFVASLPVDGTRVKQPARPTPLMLVHGTLDPLVKWNGGEIAGNRGQMRSAAATVAWWVSANRAARVPGAVTLLPDRVSNDACTLERREHAAGPGGAPVAALTMNGGGHAMPSAKYPLPDSLIVRRFIGPVCRDVEGTALAWAFLSAHKR